VDLLKIDVEGNEVSVLEGAAQSLKENRIRSIQFEYNTTWLPGRFQLRDAFKILNEFGFRLYKIQPDFLVDCEAFSVSDENYRLCNYFALHKDTKWSMKVLRR
jgi:hypothetical protein